MSANENQINEVFYFILFYLRRTKRKKKLLRKSKRKMLTTFRDEATSEWNTRYKLMQNVNGIDFGWSTGLTK